jgi:hypothetical protein
MWWPFNILLVGHIMTGSIGILSFWVPILARKGGSAHRQWGRVFCRVLLVTGSFAVGMSICTLIDPLGTHHDLHDAAMIRNVFGWMMLYLGALTVSLAWHGLQVLKNKHSHTKNRNLGNVLLQVVVILLALNCAIWGALAHADRANHEAQFWMIGALMMGISVVGIASGATNLWFVFRAEVTRAQILKEHVKALVGAGISAYTAFLAFGMVRLNPAYALNPIVWSIPLIVGMSLILWHHWQIGRADAARRPALIGRPDTSLKASG